MTDFIRGQSVVVKKPENHRPLPSSTKYCGNVRKRSFYLFSGTRSAINNNGCVLQMADMLNFIGFFEITGSTELAATWA
jgi:hypothetical protein